ncbi:MAG: hypothetical protein ACXQTH_03990 [Dehalococcoidia bacterium]
MKDRTMETQEALNKQLEDVVARIDKAGRELKALRRNPAESSRAKSRAGFIASKERMIEVAEAAKRLDILKQQEHEIRAKLRVLSEQEPLSQ